MMRIGISLSNETNEKLNKYSAHCGYTKSEYIASLIEKSTPMPIPPHAFWKAMSELEAICTESIESSSGNEDVIALCENIEQWSLSFKQDMILPREIK